MFLWFHQQPTPGILQAQLGEHQLRKCAADPRSLRQNECSGHKELRAAADRPRLFPCSEIAKNETSQPRTSPRHHSLDLRHPRRQRSDQSGHVFLDQHPQCHLKTSFSAADSQHSLGVREQQRSYDGDEQRRKLKILLIRNEKRF